MLKPSAVAAAVAVASDAAVAKDNDPAGELAAAILIETRVFHGPSDAPAAFGEPVAKLIQRCPGCVTAWPPKHQSSSAFSA